MKKVFVVLMGIFLFVGCSGVAQRLKGLSDQGVKDWTVGLDTQEHLVKNFHVIWIRVSPIIKGALGDQISRGDLKLMEQLDEISLAVKEDHLTKEQIGNTLKLTTLLSESLVKTIIRTVPSLLKFLPF